MPQKPKAKPKSKFRKQPIPEDFELSDDEPTIVKLDEEQKLTSKSITFDCPTCSTKLQLQNEIEINPKGIKCKCNGCSFKFTRNNKTMNVDKSDDGNITLECEDHSIQFSFNRLTTPPNEDEANKNKMRSDVMGTPRNRDIKMNDMD